MSNGRPTWVAPWGYREGWWIAAGLVVIGYALQWVAGSWPVHLLAWPVNGLIGLVFSLLLVLAHLFGRRWELVAWTGKIPAAMCSITLLTAFVLVMGLVLQGDESAPAWVQRLGLTEMTRSWPFLFAVWWFLAALGLATVKRMIPWRKKNIGYLLNHLGLYVAVLAALLGAADVRRVLMELREGELVWMASDEDGHVYEMPLAMELQSFIKEEFNPKAAIVETDTHRIVPEIRGQMFEIDTGAQGQLLDWQIEVDRFIELSMPIGGRYEPIIDQGAGPSAYVRARHLHEERTVEGWITCGSFAFPHELLALDDNLSLAMTVPRASAYRSDVILYTPDQDARRITIEVNKPYAVDGWKLYQYSYDDRFGRWSPTSIIEVIRDPWLPVVYTGIFMMMAGAVYLMFKGRPADDQGKGAPNAAV